MRAALLLLLGFSLGCGVLGTECTTDLDCNENEICGDSPRVCTEGCYSDDDCEAGLICSQTGMCQEGCREHADCPEEQYCNTNGDTCENGCRDDDGCDADEECVSGSCF